MLMTAVACAVTDGRTNALDGRILSVELPASGHGSAVGFYWFGWDLVSSVPEIGFVYGGNVYTVEYLLVRHCYR
jgi:hypothetical protein